MTPEQFCELLNYIKKNNCWGDGMYEVCVERHRIAVKYVRACFDSRDGKVWSVELDSGGGAKKSFRVESETDLKKVYEFLDMDTRRSKWQEKQAL